MRNTMIPHQRITSERWIEMFGNINDLPRGRGFTLVEVLVSLLIFSIGLLGMAALQMTSLRNNQASYFHSQVTQFAYDIADRMRANPVSTNAQDYDDPQGTKTQEGFDPQVDCLAISCEPADMAAWDLSQWARALANAVPGAKGVVCLDATPEDGAIGDAACSGMADPPYSYAVKIWWDDNRSGDTEQYQRFVMVFQP